MRNEAVHGLVGPLHEAVGADGDDGVLHAVEQGFELALAGADGGKTFFDAAGGFIDGGGDAADFILRSFVDAGLEIAFGDAGGDFDDAFEAAGGPIGGDGGHYESEEEGQTGSQCQAVANLRGDGFHIGERIGEADGAAEHDVEGDGGSQDDDRKGRHQLEENPVSHFFFLSLPLLSVCVSLPLITLSVTLGPRSGSRRRARS